MANKIPISAIIITKNEGKNILSCLQSLSFVQEIIIIDSGSTDKTIEIAKDFGCQVFIEEWKGYGPQKQSAVEKASFKWILSLDADERIPEETAEIITQVIKKPLAKAYSFPRKNIFHGKWIKHAGWWPDRVIRLFHKNYGKFEGLIHESWKTKEKVIHLNTPIIHYPFKNYSHMIQKMDLYSSIAAKELSQKANIATNPFNPILHGTWMFIRTYFLKLGFIDGFDGLIISLYNAGNSFLKYAKLREIKTTKN